MKPWINTDELQWVRAISEDKFFVLNVTFCEVYVLQEVEVNFSEFNDDELNREVKGYYESLEEVKKTYNDSWKQIVAEIIAENTQIDLECDNQFENLIKLNEYLESKYGINVE